MTPSLRPQLSPLMIEDLVRNALLEDLGRAGDITTYATIGPEKTATAALNSRETGVVAGLPLAEAAFRLIDPTVRFEALVADGDTVAPGQAIARVSGNARSVLSAERVALNFLMHLSGVASYTARFAGEDRPYQGARHLHPQDVAGPQSRREIRRAAGWRFQPSLRPR